MATVLSLFRILRWAIILTLVLIIILRLAPLAFPRHFSNSVSETDEYKISSGILAGLCVFGLIAVGCHFFYMTLLFALSMLIYLIAELVFFRLSIYGTLLPITGIIICSFTLSAALRRLKHEAMYGV